MFHVNVFYLNELVINLSIKIEIDTKAFASYSSERLIFTSIFYIRKRKFAMLNTSIYICLDLQERYKNEKKCQSFFPCISYLPFLALLFLLFSSLVVILRAFRSGEIKVHMGNLVT